MFGSLRLRLLAGFLLVAIAAVGVVATFASQVTSGQFRGYVETRVEQGRNRYEVVLGRYFVEQGRSWVGVQALVERIAEISGDHIVLVNASGVVIADSARRLVGMPAERTWVGGPTPVFRPGPGMRVGGGPELGRGPLAAEGSAASAYFVNPLALQEIDSSFLDAVNRWLLLAAAAAGVLALVLALGVSRGVLGPIESLTAAARRMESGDLGSRVAVKGKDEIGTLAHAFNAMAESLSKNEALRRHMVSDVAHELRTPLTNIRGYLEGLRDGVLEPDRETLGSVFEESQLLSRLVDDLQDLALAEAGQLRMVKQRVSPDELVERAVAAVRFQFEERRVKLGADLASDLPIVNVDPERIGQVLRNLLINALAHTPPGGQVTVGAAMRDGAVELTVRDTGSGIPAEHLPNVFERFFRVDQSRARKSGGAGLGLAIAKQLVEAHGGHIIAESVLGQGSTFRIVLPMPGA